MQIFLISPHLIFLIIACTWVIEGTKITTD